MKQTLNKEFCRRLHARTGRMGFAGPDDIRTGAGVAVYGAGATGRDIRRRLEERRPDVEVRFFIDTFQEGERDGLPVKRFDMLSPDIFAEITVLVASTAWPEIERTLVEQGVSDYLVFDHRGGFRDAFVLPQCRAVYLGVPKAASSSIVYALRTALGMSTQGEWKEDSMSRVDLKAGQFRDFFTFSFVRNPFDRVVSFYRSVFLDPDPAPGRKKNFIDPLCDFFGKKEISFADFVSYVSEDSDEFANTHWLSQHILLYEPFGDLLVDFVGRFESLERDFEFVCERIGVRAELPRVNPGLFRDSDHRVYYDEVLKEKIGERYHKDLEYFGYEF